MTLGARPLTDSSATPPKTPQGGTSHQASKYTKRRRDRGDQNQAMDVAAIASTIANAYVPTPGAGRPGSIQDSASLEKFLRETVAGLSLPRAAALANLSHTTIRKWLERGEASTAVGAIDPYVLFVSAYKTAEAIVISDSTKKIRDAGKIPAHWAAEMTFLERRFPEEFARPGDRQQGHQAGMFMVIRGLRDEDIEIGVSLSPPRLNSESETLANCQQTASVSDNRSSVNLPYSQSIEGTAKEIAPFVEQSRDARLCNAQAPGSVWSNGATAPEGTLPPAPPASGDAVTTTKSDLSTLTSTLTKAGTVRKRPSYSLPAVERDPSQVTKTDLKYRNPAAARRAAQLHAEGKRKRRVAKTAKRLKDALRYAASKKKEAARAEAALPEDVIG